MLVSITNASRFKLSPLITEFVLLSGNFLLPVAKVSKVFEKPKIKLLEFFAFGWEKNLLVTTSREKTNNVPRTFKFKFCVSRLKYTYRHTLHSKWVAFCTLILIGLVIWIDEVLRFSAYCCSYCWLLGSASSNINILATLETFISSQSFSTEASLSR